MYEEVVIEAYITTIVISLEIAEYNVDTSISGSWMSMPSNGYSLVLN